jgi:hypothetical protein
MPGADAHLLGAVLFEADGRATIQSEPRDFPGMRRALRRPVRWLVRFPVDMGRNTQHAPAWVAAHRPPALRHPGAARPRSGRAGIGRDPCTSKASSRIEFRNSARPAKPSWSRPIGEHAETAWIPAQSRSGLSGPSGAGMTWWRRRATRTHRAPGSCSRGPAKQFCSGARFEVDPGNKCRDDMEPSVTVITRLLQSTCAQVIPGHGCA